MYEGWEIKRRLTFTEKPHSLAFVDASRLAALYKRDGGSIVSLYDWGGQHIGSVPCLSSMEIDYLLSDGNLIFAIDRHGNQMATWAVELFRRIKS